MIPADYQAEAQEIAALLSSLEGAGVVHARVRTAANWGQFIERFRDADGYARGWQVSRRAAGLAEHRWDETWGLLRVLSVVDAEESEISFQQHLNAAVRLFRSAELSFASIPEGLGYQVDERWFGDVLCHVAECEIKISRYYSTV